MYTKKYKMVIFDLDGVLIDSKNNMKISWNKLKKELNINVSFNEYFKYIGFPFKTILRKLKISQNHKKIQRQFSKNSIDNLKKIKPYSGVHTTLKVLKSKNIKICIVTSKDKFRTKKIIKLLKFPINYFFSPEKNLRGKPNPDQINKALKKLSVKKKDACYVGDMVVDFKAANNANIDFIYANYGYGNYKKNFYKIIKKPKEIIKFIQ